MDSRRDYEIGDWVHPKQSPYNDVYRYGVVTEICTHGMIKVSWIHAHLENYTNEYEVLSEYLEPYCPTEEEEARWTEKRLLI